MALLTCCAASDCLIIAVLACGLFYLFSTWTYSHWKKRGVPCASTFPLLGSLKESALGRISLGQAYEDIYRELKPFKFGGFFKFREPSLMICDAELIKTVAVREFTHFHDNDIHVTVEDDSMFGRNPFCLRGDRWKVVRSQMTPAFTPAKIKPFYFPLINEVCKGLTDYLKKHPEGLDTKDLAAKFTTDVVASCAFGMNGHSFTDPNSTFRQMGRDIISPDDWWTNFKWMFIFLAPQVAKFFKFRVFSEKVVDFFRGAVTEAMRQREINHVVRNDFLQMMLQLKAKGAVDGDVTDNSAHHSTFTNEDITAQAIVFFSDGFETSSTALSFALYELAVNPDVQKRLRNEVDTALEDNGGHITYELIQEVAYLEMVLSEAMRKYPPVPFFNRLCTKPYMMHLSDGGELLIEEGTSITVSINGVHYDPEHYPDPERFDPERFTDEQKATRHSHSYLPFGSGPRVCIGSRFALTQMKAGLAAIVSKFEIRLSKQTSVPIVLDPTSFITAAKGGLWLEFVPREDQ